MKQIFIALSVVIFLWAFPIPVLADASNEACTGATFGDNNCTTLELETGLQKVVNIISYIVGIVSIIVAIVAGLMFSVSAGDPQKAKQARNALLFAIVGILVALMAYAMSNFVLKEVGGK